MRGWLWIPLVLLIALSVGCARDATTPPTQEPAPTSDSPALTPSVSMPTAAATPLPVPPVATAAPEAPAPSPVPAPTDAGTAQPVARAPDSFPTAPDRDLMELARSLRLKSTVPIDRIVPLPPPVLGQVETFSMVSLFPVETYTRDFELRHVSPNAYWYVQADLNVPESDLQEAIDGFEQRIYPTMAATMGTEWKPGVDDDPRMSILTGRLKGGVAGYYSSADAYPVAVHPSSNQREMVYMDATYNSVGSPEYLSVLTHELFHAVQWAADPSEETWVNEGLATLSSELIGGYPAPRRIQSPSPTPSLVHWPVDSLSSEHYAHSELFFRYLTERLAAPAELRKLLSYPADGVKGVEAFLAETDIGADFRQVFGDWLVANLLDEPEGGRYGYRNLSVSVSPSATLRQGGRWAASLLQYGTEYVELASPRQGATIRFQGVAQVPLLPTEVGAEGCWWSNRGDSISSSLERRVNLAGVEEATLSYRIWHEIEEGWDYGYVEVSADEGATWDLLPATGTTLYDPAENSYGHGYTGDTGGWLEAQADLSAYAGREVTLRFHYVTDDSINGSGLCLDRIAIPAIGFFDSPDKEGWLPQGFVRVFNSVAQEYLVQVVEMGQEPRVTRVHLDASNGGELRLELSTGRSGVVIVVAALAPKTLQPAAYTLEVAAAPPP